MADVAGLPVPAPPTPLPPPAAAPAASPAAPSQRSPARPSNTLPDIRENPLAAIGLVLRDFAAGVEGRELPSVRLKQQLIQEENLKLQRLQLGIQVAQNLADLSKNKSPEDIARFTEQFGPQMEEFFPGLMEFAVSKPDDLGSSLLLLQDLTPDLQMAVSQMGGGTPQGITEIISDKNVMSQLHKVQDARLAPRIEAKLGTLFSALEERLGEQAGDILDPSGLVNLTEPEFRSINEQIASFDPELSLSEPELATLFRSPTQFGFVSRLQRDKLAEVFAEKTAEKQAAEVLDADVLAQLREMTPVDISDGRGVLAARAADLERMLTQATPGGAAEKSIAAQLRRVENALSDIESGNLARLKEELKDKPTGTPLLDDVGKVTIAAAKELRRQIAGNFGGRLEGEEVVGGDAELRRMAMDRAVELIQSREELALPVAANRAVKEVLEAHPERALVQTMEQRAEFVDDANLLEFSLDFIEKEMLIVAGGVGIESNAKAMINSLLGQVNPAELTFPLTEDIRARLAVLERRLTAELVENPKSPVAEQAFVQQNIPKKGDWLTSPAQGMAKLQSLYRYLSDFEANRRLKVGAPPAERGSFRNAIKQMNFRDIEIVIENLEVIAPFLSIEDQNDLADRIDKVLEDSEAAGGQ